MMTTVVHWCSPHSPYLPWVRSWEIGDMAEKTRKPQRETNKLAAVNLKRLRPGLHGDGGGLWLQVTANRRGRSWVFRYSFNGRAREMGLGSLDTIGLAEAREQA